MLVLIVSITFKHSTFWAQALRRIIVNFVSHVIIRQAAKGYIHETELQDNYPNKKLFSVIN